MTLFDRLRHDAGPEWENYIAHPFVASLADGVLPPAAFRRYLTQDTLFLVHFARACGLAAFKSETLAEIREASATLSALLEVEMPLHLDFCARWGLDDVAIAAEPETLELVAYTRFVLERGLAGDRLDLDVALAPCILGYAEIGSRLAGAATRSEHPYGEWIRTYAGAAYQTVASDAKARLDRLWGSRGSDARYPRLLATFRQAVRLETAFWQMGFV